MNLKVICLSISLALINFSITAMETHKDAERTKQTFINQQLHTEITIQDLDEVKRLIEEEKADVNSCDDTGSSSLSSAIHRGAWDIAKYILTRDDININLADNCKWTALYSASSQGAADIVQRLLDKGADTSLATNNGLTPRDIALVYGFINIVSILDEHSMHKK